VDAGFLKKIMDERKEKRLLEKSSESFRYKE